MSEKSKKDLIEQRNGKKFEERHEYELSGRRYALKEILQNLVMFGSIGLGAFGGYRLAKAKPEWFTKLLDKFHWGELVTSKLGENAPQYTGGVIGGALGSMIGGTALTYEHWRKEEATKLAVKEINEDVANTLTIRERANPELIKENDTLRQMYEAAKDRNTQLEASLNGRGNKEPDSALKLSGTKIQTSGLEQSKLVEDKTLSQNL